MLIVLSATAVSFARLDYNKWRMYERNRDSRVLEALSGSFSGYAGGVFRSGPGVVAGAREIVVFVVHQSKLASDLAHWSAVAADLNRTTGSGSVRLLGYCDTGGGCGGAAASFRIFEYGDPFQMHAVGFADANGLAIIFDGKADTIGFVPTSTPPGVAAKQIFVAGAKLGRQK